MSGILKRAILLGIVVLGIMVPAKDVKAAETVDCDAACGQHQYIIDGDTITISNKSESTNATISKYCKFSDVIQSNSSIKYVVVESGAAGITGIDNYAFNECTNLEKITLQSGVTTIGMGAFFNCNHLKSIVIPDSLTSIGEKAFSSCKQLESIEIPNSVTSIGAFAFETCWALTSIILPTNVTAISNYAFSGCKALKNITIPNNVTTIGQGAFQQCLALTTITIPAKVTNIERNAFDMAGDPNNLKEIIIEGTPTIGTGAFGCCSPKTLTINGNYSTDQLSRITSTAFNGCSPETVIFGENVTNPSLIKQVIDESGLSTTCKSNLTVVVKDTATKDSLTGDNALSSDVKKVMTQAEYEASLHPSSPSKPASTEKSTVATTTDTKTTEKATEKVVTTTTKKNTVTQEQIIAYLRMTNPELLEQIFKSVTLQLQVQTLQREYAQIDLEKQLAMNDYNIKHRNAQMMYTMYIGTALEANYKAQLEDLEKQYQELVKLYDKKYAEVQKKMSELLESK